MRAETCTQTVLAGGDLSLDFQHRFSIDSFSDIDIANV